MHAMVTHVIDRGGRFAAKFHGLRFDPTNLVLNVTA
jgi:protein SCO1/2